MQENAVTAPGKAERQTPIRLRHDEVRDARPDAHSPGKRTIIFVAPAWFAVRYFLRTEILHELVRSNKIDIVVLARPEYVDRLRAEFADMPISVRPLAFDEIRRYHASWFRSRLAQAARFIMNADVPIDTAIYLEHQFFQRYRGRGRIRHLTQGYLRALIWAGRRSRYVRAGMRELANLLAPRSFHDNDFRTLDPALIVMPSLGYFDVDAYLVRSARRHHVPSVGVVVNWDNTTNKGMTLAAPDFAIVWGDKMRQESIVHHDMTPASVFAAGAAHYDGYFRPERLVERSVFCRARGLDPAKPIVLYASMSPRRYPYNPQVTEILARAAGNGSLGMAAQVLVRLHPIYLGFQSERPANWAKEMQAFDDIRARYPHVVVEAPSGIAGASKTFDLDQSDSVTLASTLYHSAVVVCFFSTLNLEAALVDRPVINCALFDLGRWTGPDGRIRVPTHLRNLASADGCRIVRDEAALVAEIAAYLRNPQRDADYRRNLAAFECGMTEGRSGARVASLLLQLAGQ